jgi:Protein of unknown function (DUF2934)
MAKNTNGGAPKGGPGEIKGRRAVARRRTEKPSPDGVVASATDLARVEPENDRRAATGGPATTPSPDEVRRRAYELYVRRGGTHGNDLEDWLEAERQLRGRTH